MIRSVVAATAAALLAAVGVTAAAAPAQAAQSCGITVPSRVAMDAPYKRVPVTYGYDCVANDAFASWDFIHSYYGLESMALYDSDIDDRFDVWEMYDWSPLGAYTVEPGGAYSMSTYADLYQNTTATTVKLGTRVALSVTRSGGRAYFTTTTSAYSPARDAFSRYPNAKVGVQYKACSNCAWQNLRTGYTNSYAAWSFNIASTKKFYFRGVLYSGPKTLDAQGPAIYR